MKKNVEALIKDKIDRLVALSLNPGVQIEELVSNIYEYSYKNISISKDNSVITLELLFEEDDIEKPRQKYKVKYLYTYSYNKVLLKIDCIIENHKKNEWDRSQVELNTINEIIDLLKNNSLDKHVNKFIKSLPAKLQSEIKARLIA